MNRIYLDKLSEFVINTYNNNYNQLNKQINLDEEVEMIKQNNSLNEKGVFIKHNIISLSSIISNLEQDELVLLNPLCFNIHGDIEWYNLLNSLLSVLNKNYINEDNLIKKNILESADKMYKKKIVFTEYLNEKIIKEVCINTNISLIIITKDDIKVYNLGDENRKVIVLFKNNKEYYPIINWVDKYFKYNNNFIKYLLELYGKKEVLDNNVINDCYEELTTNENYALYISEAVDNNIISNKKNNLSSSDNKKKNKKTKDIFIVNKENKVEEKVVIEEKKLKKLSNKKEDTLLINTNIKLEETEINEIKKKVKITMLLNELQEIAKKLGIDIIKGLTRDEKKKNKTKQELYDEIIEKVSK